MFHLVIVLSTLEIDNANCKGWLVSPVKVYSVRSYPIKLLKILGQVHIDAEGIVKDAQKWARIAKDEWKKVTYK